MISQSKLVSSFTTQFLRSGVDSELAYAAASICASGRLDLTPSERAVLEGAWFQLRLC